jgi:hypothetical protein
MNVAKKLLLAGIFSVPAVVAAGLVPNAVPGC